MQNTIASVWFPCMKKSILERQSVEDRYSLESEKSHAASVMLPVNRGFLKEWYSTTQILLMW